MKSFKQVIKTLGLVAVVVTSSLSANEESLVGVWKLTKSENITPSGEVVSYCTGVHGFIFYTESGYMSVALNCAPKGVGKEPADISGRKFFYMGTYEFDGEKVTHDLFNASDVHLIGEKASRSVESDGKTLVLSGENQGTKFSAHWERVDSERSVQN